MKIAVNLHLLRPGEIGGMEVYVRNIIDHGLRVSETLSFVLFVTDDNRETFDYPPDRVQLITVEQGGDSDISALVDTYGADVYFCPLFALTPRTVTIPTAICIPDVQHEFHPDFFPPEVLEWRREHLKASARIADAVLTLSEFSRGTIVDRLGVEATKVHAIHLAADDRFQAPPDERIRRSVRQRFGLPEKYAFFPANAWPHKNHTILLKAWDIYRARYGNPPMLVLTGASPDGDDRVFREISDLGLAATVRHLGYVPREDLPSLYTMAEFLVFPSLFEGFGMPVLEAMHAGCPVLCSRATSLPEIAGTDAALYFDPTDPSVLADLIRRAMTDRALRERLRNAGVRRVQAFSWDATARETLLVLERVARLKPESRPGRFPKVTIVTPSLNQGRFIEETILSVLNQDYPNIEHIVQDGGSKDDTLAILEKYGDRYSERFRWNSGSDRGQADAVNRGFRAAAGEILGWVNSDDTLLPGSVSRVVEHFLNNPDDRMTYGHALYTTIDGETLERYPTEHPFDLGRLAERCFICQPTVFLSRSVLDEVGYLDIDLETCMDLDFWIRTGKRFPDSIGFIDDVQATSRMYNENKTCSMRERVYREIVHTIWRHYGCVPETWIEGYVTELIDCTRKPRWRARMRVFRFLVETVGVLGAVRSFPLITHSILHGLRPRVEILGTFSDRWATGKLTLDIQLPRGRNSVEIVGQHCWPLEDPLCLSALSGGNIIGNIQVDEKGDFVWHLTLPIEDTGVQQGRCSITIQSSKVFVPSDLGINEDERSLSFRFLGLR